MKAVLIPQIRTEPVKIIELTTPDWRGMRDAVNGATGTQCQYIESVGLVPTSPLVNHVMIVDEEGLYHDEAQVNLRALAFYPHGAGIRGNALIMELGYTEDGPDMIDLRDPEGTLDKIALYLTMMFSNRGAAEGVWSNPV